MRYLDLVEGKNTPCIVVDVQPAYTGVNDGQEWSEMDDLMQFLNNQSGPILMFVNAESDGLTGDTVDDIRMYWEDSGFDPSNWSRVTVNDKGYGYLRGWMDQDVDPSAIIKAIRLMYQQKVYDSRELFDGDDSEDYIEQMASLGVPENVLDDAISIEWLSIAQLKQFSPGYLMGGGRHECLREVQLMMNAFNLRHKEIDRFIY